MAEEGEEPRNPRFKIPLKELPVLLALFLDLTAFGMVFPDVQLHARALGATGWLIGMLLASMFVVQMVVSPPWGALSDRIGRKPVFIACTLISASSWLVYALSTNLWLVLLSRVLAGFAAANVVVAQAFLADSTSDSERSAAMGRAGAAISGGLILGPAVGMQIAAHLGVRSLGFAACVISSLAVISGLMMASVKPKPRDPNEAKKSFGLNLRLLKGNRPLQSIVLLATVAWFALATLEGTFGRLVTEHFHLPATVFGNIFSMESLLGGIVQGFLLGWIVTRLKERWTLMIGFALLGLGLLLTPFAPSTWILFVVSGLYSVGSALANPTLNSHASAMTSEALQGEMFGVLQASRSLGFLFGPIVGGALFDWRPYAPYVLAGTVGLICSALVTTLFTGSKTALETA